MEVCVRKGRVNQSFMCIFHQKFGEATELQDSFLLYQLLRFFFLLFSLGIVEMGRLKLGNWEETAAEELAFEPALKMLKGLGCQATKGSVIFFCIGKPVVFQLTFLS